MASQGGAAALSPIPEFFSQAWRLFISRWATIAAIALIGAAASLASLAIPFICVIPFWGHLSAVIMAILAAMAAIVAFLWFSSWAPVAMFEAALDESAGVTRCLKEGWRKIVPFSWVYILFFLLILSGFCLFIIPGIYLFVALSMACLICVAEGSTGFFAIEKSLYYVKGRWWQTFVRLILIGFVGFVPGLIPVVGWIIAAILSPLPLIMIAVLYKNLRSTREAQGAAFVPSFATKALIASAFLGLLLPLAGTVALYKTAVRAAPNFAAQWQALLNQEQSNLASSGSANQWLSMLQKMSGTSAPGP